MTLLLLAGIAFACLGLTWVAYPAAMWLRARRLPSVTIPDPDALERVCAVIATRDDPSIAARRIQNLLESDYPRDRLRVVLAADPASGIPLDAYRRALHGTASVVAGDPPGGKAATLNAAVRAAGDADVLLFADVGQTFNREAIRQLVATLRAGPFGAVTGRYEQRAGDPTMTGYASLEATIRAGQAAGRGVVSATGSILVLRPRYWRPLPDGLICDDLFTGLSVVRQGQRLGFCRDAVAHDPRPFTRDQQFARRVRTLTGLVQFMRLAPWSLLPWENRVWTHFLLHKVFRLLTPLFVLVGTIALGAWLIMNALALVVAPTVTIILTVEG